MRLRRLKQNNANIEEDFETIEHRRMIEFHPHCYLPQLAVAEAKLYDETYHLAHRQCPAHGEQD